MNHDINSLKIFKGSDVTSRYTLEGVTEYPDGYMGITLRDTETGRKVIVDDFDPLVFDAECEA